MNFLVAGSRSFYSENLDDKTLKKHYKVGLETLEKVYTTYGITSVISGKATGADTFGENWGISKELIIKECPAEWDRYGKRAGMVRNKEMGEDEDVAVIFCDEKSKGTINMINIIKKLKKPLILINFEDKEFEDEW